MGWDNLTEMVETVFIFPHRLGNHSNDFKSYMKDLLLSQNRTIEKEEAKDLTLPKSESYLFFSNLAKTVNQREQESEYSASNKKGSSHVG